MATPYNQIFDQLVGDDNDFVGIVAYTVYKRQKVEWLKQFETENNRPATDDEIRNGFSKVSHLPSQIDSYREQAITLIDNFLDVAMGQAIEENKEQVRLDAVVQAVKKSFWTSVGENLAAGIVASMLTLAAAGLIWVAAKGPENLWREAMQHFMQQHSVVPAPIAPEIDQKD